MIMRGHAHHNQRQRSYKCNVYRQPAPELGNLVGINMTISDVSYLSSEATRTSLMHAFLLVMSSGVTLTYQSLLAHYYVTLLDHAF